MFVKNILSIGLDISFSVVVREVALLADSLRVQNPLGVFAEKGALRPTPMVVTIAAHAPRIVR